MSQKLILPMPSSRLTASWKTAVYAMKYKHTHYGADIQSMNGTPEFFSSGKGEVLATGRDKEAGLVLLVYYPQAQHRIFGDVRDVIFRYFYLERVAVQAGQVVEAGDLLGEYGGKGLRHQEPHLHLEVDMDTTKPTHTPTVEHSDFLIGRRDGAVGSYLANPIEWLHCQILLPQRQRYATNGSIYIRLEDYSMGERK